MTADGQAPEESRAAATRFELSNEFASVTVELVTTRNGERLRVASTRTGTEILLDPVELEALSWQDHDGLSGLLRTRPEEAGDDG